MAVPLVDFSPLGDLYNTYQQARQQKQSQDWLQQQGLPGNMNLAQLALQQQALARGEARDARDFGFRQQEATRAQGNQDRTFGLQQQQFQAGIEGAKMQPGFERDPDTGGQRPIKGGIADPDYLRRKTEATDKGRQMSITDITKLTEEGQKFSDLTRFGDSFKDNFAGYSVGVIGNLSNVAGRNLPEGVVGKDRADQAAWWQGYDRYKNVVRHELYGTSLTKPETQAFEAADITPGMQPEQIRKNLALQKSIVENGLKRKASAMVAAGYDPKAIGAAYGVDLTSIGVDPTKRGAAPAQGAPQVSAWRNKETITAARQNPQATIAEAQQAIAGGANPQAVAQRLKQIGIDPSALTNNTGFAGPGARE